MEAAAAILGIAEITVRSGSKLWNLRCAWRDAPAELQRLSDELAQIQHFFCETERGIRRLYSVSSSSSLVAPFEKSGALGASIDGLDELLESGAVVLRNIEAFIDALYSAEKNGEGKALSQKRRAMWLAHKGKITKLRSELHNITLSICRRLIAQNVSISAEIQTSITSSRDDILSHTEGIQSNVVSHFDRQFGSLQTHMVKVVEPLREQVSLLQLQLGPPQAGIKRTETVKWASYIRHSIPPPRRVPRCSITCQCRCHAPATYSSWKVRSLSAFLGSFSLTYSARPTKMCTELSCRSNDNLPHTQVNVVYHFPDWIVRAAVSLFFSSNLHGSPEFNVRVLNRIPIESAALSQSIFGLIARRDVCELRRQLAEKRVSVYDVRDDDMTSGLSLAMRMKDATMIRLLLQAGADPYQESHDDAYTTPMDVALLQSLFGDEASKASSEAFPIFDHLLDQEQPVLHLVILGVLHMDLATVLRQPEHAQHISNTCIAGAAPLHLAALNGNNEAVRLLLRAGADANQKTFQGWTSLHLACRSGGDETARLLLDAGASVTDREPRGWTPLMSAVMSHASEPRLLRMLLRQGAELEAVDRAQSTALTFASVVGNLVAMNFLLDCGADINHTDWEGDTPLTNAVWNRQYEAVKLLLARGADFTRVDAYGRNMLHRLAIEADAKMMRIFTRIRMVGVSTIARDKDDKTPGQLFDGRTPPPDDELIKAWGELLDEVEMANEGRDGWGRWDDSDEEVFVDAVEKQ
ncbi:ankyrin repeat-containing domain protein [Echria macrotheca]|uniref:Ankyrin repeat-containing domain protein n=1 Tax=Echria macrotheca TaxID=438768 RepID=A0AAJ0F9K5_9PEZI|nr:ankyrin repeat-containing domain protein [Echria macrotheca]